VIPQQDLPLEFMLNALRLKQGFDSDLFFNTSGLLITQLEAALKKAESKGLIERNNKIIRPTRHGFQFLNELLELFMPENFPLLADKNKIHIKSVS